MTEIHTEINETEATITKRKKHSDIELTANNGIMIDTQDTNIILRYTFLK